MHGTRDTVGELRALCKQLFLNAIHHDFIARDVNRHDKMYRLDNLHYSLIASW